MTVTVREREREREEEISLVYIRLKEPPSPLRKRQKKAKHHLAFKISFDETKLTKLLCGKVTYLSIITSDFCLMNIHDVMKTIVTDKEDKICWNCCRTFFDFVLPAKWDAQKTERGAEKGNW